MNGGLSMVEMKSGYKMTEVGVIPEDWEVKELSSISAIKSGKRLPKGSLVTSSKTPYPYIRVIDMNMGYLNLSNIMYVPENVQPMISKYIISKNDIYISVAGTLGLVGKIPEELDGANLTENANRITEIQCNRDYLMYYMMSPLIQNVIEAERTIGAQPKLALQRIRDFYIVLPRDKREQTAIATALSDVDSLISTLTKKIEKKKAIKQGLMQQLLTGKKRLPGFCGDWMTYSIEELFELGNGYTPSKAITSFWFNGTIPWFRMEDIRLHGRILKDSIQHITLKAVKGGRLFPKDSIILSTTATIGEHAWLNVDSLANQQFTFLMRKRSCCDTISVKYFFYYCYILGDWCRANINEGGLMAVNMEDLRKYNFAIPPTISEQTAIANILSDCDSEIAALKEKRDKYKEIKQGMMQQLLTGKIRLIK